MSGHLSGKLLRNETFAAERSQFLMNFNMMTIIETTKKLVSELELERDASFIDPRDAGEEEEKLRCFMKSLFPTSKLEREKESYVRPIDRVANAELLKWDKLERRRLSKKHAKSLLASTATDLDDAESDAAMMLEDEAREEEELRRKEDEWIYGECWHQPDSNCGCRVPSQLYLLAQQKVREEKDSNQARLVQAWTKARNEYQIFVVPPQGNTIALDVNANWTVEKLMSKLKKRLPIPSRPTIGGELVSKFRFKCGSQELDVNRDAKKTLRDCQVNKESTVHILLRVLGGSTKKPSYGTGE